MTWNRIQRAAAIREYTDLLLRLAGRIDDPILNDRIERSLAELGRCEVRMLAHDFPLRPDLSIRVDLPVDLTVAEAERLSRMVHAIAFEDQPPQEDPQ